MAMKSLSGSSSVIAERGQELAEQLRLRAVPSEQIDRMLASGYYLRTISMYGMGESIRCVADSFYGSKWLVGLTPIDEFLSGATHPGPFLIPSAVRTYTVGSLAEIESILANERHAKFHQAGRLSFRGQSREYHVRRPFPNPVLALNGAERLIIPSFWRRFRDGWSKRFDATVPPSIFTTIYGDDLIYYGIPDWQTLAERNVKRYGLHTMSDLEDFPDVDSREYGRRWQKFKVAGSMRMELPLVEQHYGIDTAGLDVTFDVGVAAFFAANRFVTRAEDGTAHFLLPPPGGHTGVLYGFVFRDPPLRREEELVREIPIFDHIRPLRPIHQQCALPFFHALNLNEAACDLDFVMHLTPDFDPSGLPEQRHLFPSRADDPFYDAALAVRQKFSECGPYNQFIEYRFD